MARETFRKAWQDPVTTTYATAALLAAAGMTNGLFRYEDDGTTNGLKKYVLLQATTAFTQYQAASFDTTTNGVTAAPCTAAGAFIIGIAQVAVTINYFAWFLCGGIGTVIQKTSTTAGDPLTSTTTAGALGQATETGSGAYKHVAAVCLVTNSSGSDANKIVYMRM